MNFFPSIVVSFVASVLLVPVNMIFARRFGMVDDPKKRKHPAILHKTAVPRAGGLAIYLSIVITIFLTFEITKQLIGIMLGGLILICLGIVDDKIDIKKSWIKILAQIAAALVVVGSGIGISFITNPFQILGIGAANPVIRFDTLKIVFDFLGTHSIVVWADLFAIFWIVWVINMVNFSAGVDGQLPGIAVISLFIIFAISLRFSTSDPSQILVAKLALSGVGATLGFLIYNYHPAKIFPGDSGSYFLGFLIATLSILSGAKIGTALLVMAVPLIDGVFTVVRRLAEGKSPFLGDRKHLHHRLLEIGLSQAQVALLYWLFCAVLGIIALTISADLKLFAGVVVAIIVLGGILWLNLNLRNTDRE